MLVGANESWAKYNGKAAVVRQEIARVALNR